MNRQSAMSALRALPLFTSLLLGGMWFAAGTAWSQSGPGGSGRTIWDGVYQEAQAVTGEGIYRDYCSNCHGAKLTGGANQGAPALLGPVFMENWREDSAENLFLTIRNNMPRQNTNKVLTDAESIDLIAFIFSRNEFPVGEELTRDSVPTVRIQLKEGPKDLPNYSQLQVVGCLTQEAANWTLTSAALPMRLRTSAEKATPQEIAAAAAKPLGDSSFRLQNLIMLGSFKPAEHKGHKMLAKGVLIRQGGNIRISVTEMEMVSAECAAVRSGL